MYALNKKIEDPALDEIIRFAINISKDAEKLDHRCNIFRTLSASIPCFEQVDDINKEAFGSDLINTYYKIK